MPTFAPSGLEPDAAAEAATLLQDRLNSLIDLQLTLKHVHWNVVGPTFIGVHEMLDPQVDAVRAMTDTVAERIATLGGVPHGTPGYVVAQRDWDDYDLGRATVEEHLAALDLVYTGVISDHRAAFRRMEELDTVSHDMLVGHTADLELFQWFVRSHLANAGGELRTEGATTERQAAQRVSA